MPLVRRSFQRRWHQWRLAIIADGCLSPSSRSSGSSLGTIILVARCYSKQFASFAVWLQDPECCRRSVLRLWCPVAATSGQLCVLSVAEGRLCVHPCVSCDKFGATYFQHHPLAPGSFGSCMAAHGSSESGCRDPTWQGQMTGSRLVWGLVNLVYRVM